MAPPTEHREPRDDGMTLIEVVVAIGLFAVMATAVLSVLSSAIAVTRDDKARLEAINLASRELEITRDTFSSVTRGPDQVATNRVVNPSPLPGGTAGQPLVIDKVPYTVVRTAQWSSVDSQAATTCDEGTTTELAYLHVVVEVSWPALGDRPPVTMDTVMTPPKGTYSALTGHIGLKVIDSLGNPQPGVQVTAKSSTGETKTGATSGDGCALLAFLPAGSYAITVSAPGYVNPKGDPTGTTTAQVQTGQLWRGSIEYDLASTITATFATTAGYPAPTGTGLAVSIGNSAIQPVGSRSIVGAGNPRVLTNLWPYPSGYQLWAGGCQDNDPDFTGDQRDLPVEASAGGSTAGTIALAPLEIRAAASKPVVAKHASDGLCPTGATIQLGSTDATGVLKVSIPFGAWTITAGTATKAVAAYQGDPPQVVTVP